MQEYRLRLTGMHACSIPRRAIAGGCVQSAMAPLADKGFRDSQTTYLFCTRGSTGSVQVGGPCDVLMSLTPCSAVLSKHCVMVQELIRSSTGLHSYCPGADAEQMQRQGCAVSLLTPLCSKKALVGAPCRHTLTGSSRIRCCNQILPASCRSMLSRGCASVRQHAVRFSY